MAFLEIYVDQQGGFDPEKVKQVAKIASGRFEGVRLVWSSVYSYQGGNHGPNPPAERPPDWAGETVGIGDARDGDYLLCIGTEDRYHYADERGLIYKKVDTLEEALTYLETLSFPDQT
ncbi:MAG: hypothetical protein ACFFCW_39030 [Candidatus Hodarchaeota archaeon]